MPDILATLDRLQALCDAATTGPWAVGNEGKPLFGEWLVRQDPRDWDGMGYQLICVVPASKKGSYYGEMFRSNSQFIAHARTALPRAIAALRVAVTTLDDLAKYSPRVRETLTAIAAALEARDAE